MLSQHSKKHHAGAPNIVPDPLVDPGNPPRRYQARSTAHPDRPRSRMVALAASSPGRRAPRSPQTNNATVMLGAPLCVIPAICFDLATFSVHVAWPRPVGQRMIGTGLVAALRHRVENSINSQDFF